MKRQFTIITKDGSKWLRPVRDCVEAQDYIDEMIDNAFGVSDVPYIGNHPEGTTVDESEVREVRQFMIGGTIDMDDTIIEHGDWITMHDFDKAGLEADLPDFLKRNAYTDAESHDMHITDTMETEEQLAYKSLEEIHKHTTLCANDDEENLFVVGFIYGLRQGKSHDRHIRPFRIHNARPLVNQLVGEEISFSRFIELLNEIANGN